MKIIRRRTAAPLLLTLGLRGDEHVEFSNNPPFYKERILVDPPLARTSSVSAQMLHWWPSDVIGSFWIDMHICDVITYAGILEKARLAAPAGAGVWLARLNT